MNILVVVPSKSNQYELRSLFERVLKGDVRVNLDSYFPLRVNPEVDYPELNETKEKTDSHLVVITSPSRGHLIKRSYLEKMDLVIRARGVKA